MSESHYIQDDKRSKYFKMLENTQLSPSLLEVCQNFFPLRISGPHRHA